jgi:glycosyltransferase involved in cell wall biosynthesis
MTLRVTFYCPDKHISFYGHTPDRVGIGGGLTARIRLAGALARRGHQVTMVAFTPKEHWYEQVHYLPLETVDKIDTDVLIASSSGDKLDLSPVLELKVRAALRIAWVHGTPKLGGIAILPFDYLYTPSNFIRQVVQDEWGLPASTRLFVSYNGVERRFFKKGFFRRTPERNPHQLVYMGHPNKGLQGALGVLHVLREQDSRYELHIYGGDGLYGGKDQAIQGLPGVVYHGTVGQKQLCQELTRYGFALNLQSVREAYGISMMEAMTAGCIVIASPAGAYAELVKQGYNGFLIPGDHLSQTVQATAAQVIQDLVSHPSLTALIQRQGAAAPLDTDTMAAACEDHWIWALGDTKATLSIPHTCPECGGGYIGLADGYHSVGCGRYDQALL